MKVLIEIVLILIIIAIVIIKLIAINAVSMDSCCNINDIFDEIKGDGLIYVFFLLIAVLWTVIEKNKNK